MTPLVNVTDSSLVIVSSRNVVSTDIQTLKMSLSEEIQTLKISLSEGKMILFPGVRKSFPRTSES